MSGQKYRDAEGNVYTVEKSSKTGRCVVVRINKGGNRKIAKQFADVSGREEYVQKALDRAVPMLGWTPTP